ncbi:hypothetical protein ACFYV7_39520 [Nocardia suismassiliense]|uniref:DUF222 domain-containing protein n=1 Tax=Nocardia suismassiliense TaxID=2077092 RepID=A0ABW6R5Y0_9NOCA
MSTNDERDDTTTSVTIYRAFQELDTYLSDHVPDYHYDVDAGLAQLKNTIACLGASDNQQAQRGARLDGHTEVVESLPTGVQGATVASRREIVSERIDGLIVGELKMSSRISPEVAVRLADGIRGQRWASSWLPGRALTRQQAFSAMVLDEILTDPDELDSATMMLVMAELADDLDMSLEQVLVRLSYIKKPDNYPRSPWARCARTQGDSARSQEAGMIRQAK